MKFRDFQKHNITWDTMLRRCREDDISRRTMWFARTRILQKAEKHIFYPWAWWSLSRDMWFGRYRWSWRLNIYKIRFSQITVNILSWEKLTWRSIRKPIFMKIMRYYQCQIQYLSPTCQNVLASNVVTSVSLTKAEGEFTQEKWFIILSQSFIGWNRKDLDFEQ